MDFHWVHRQDYQKLYHTYNYTAAFMSLFFPRLFQNKNQIKLSRKIKTTSAVKRCVSSTKYLRITSLNDCYCHFVKPHFNGTRLKKCMQRQKLPLCCCFVSSCLIW